MFPAGRLPSPENVHINGNSSTIEWDPPYSSVNNKSDVTHVDPHITHYTVYITDNYTGDVVKVNVTDTRFTFSTSDDCPCPIYQVSAWNTGGEGKLSEPVQESSPQGKQKVSELIRLCRPAGLCNYCSPFCHLSHAVPHSIAAENISLTLEPSVVHIHIDVSSCPFMS